MLPLSFVLFVISCVFSLKKHWAGKSSYPSPRAYIKALMLAPDTKNEKFIHHEYPYSALIICISSHFVVMTLFDVFLNQDSHRILAFDP